MTTDASISASAPGSLMLLGEHAVLHGYRALVCAINRRITVHLTPVEEEHVCIRSGMGDYESPLNILMDHASLRFAIQAIRQHLDQLPGGFELQIDSDFPSDIGFGSSAAVTVATHAAILNWLLGEEPDKELLFTQALQTVHEVQGRGSGADLAASVYGGVVGYTMKPTFQPIPIIIPLTAVYCGYKTPTSEVILRVEQMHAANPQKYEQIYREMDRSVEEAVECLHRHDLTTFGAIINRNQQLMDDMGINTPELEEIVKILRDSSDIFGAKISGSGLGDCAVGIGYADLKEFDYPVYHIEISPNGCEYHE